MWDTYSAFANTYGGVIILGVKENEDGSWNATGLKEERKLLKDFWDTINNTSKVSINLLSDNDIETYSINENTIIVIHVPMARREFKPVYINNDMFNGTFKRTHEGDYHCTNLQVKSMLRDQTESTMDMKLLENLTVDQLNQDTIQSYRNRHLVLKPGHPWNNLDTKNYLQKIGAADIGNDKKFHPTAAGLLMFGDEYRIVREFPEYFLDYQEHFDDSIRWTDRLQSSSGEWSGNLFDFYFKTYNKIVQNIKIPFSMVDGNRIDDTPTHRVIREILANCLVNADFYVPRGVVIVLEKEKLKIENPGTIRVGLKQMIAGGQSDPRNKALMKMFNLIDIGERAGSGIPELFTVWKNENLEEPIIEEQRDIIDRTRLILSFRKATIGESANKNGESANKSGGFMNKTEQSLQKIIDFMEYDIEYQAKDIMNLLNLKASRTRELLTILVNQGKITSNGTTRNKIYKKTR